MSVCAYVCSELWMYLWLYAEDEGYWIVGREVKCDDPDWTNRSEGCTLGLMCGSRTKAGGSKSIRYRFSSSSKRCRLCGVLCTVREKSVSMWVLGIVCSQG